MRSAARVLAVAGSQESPESPPADSDVVVILAALLGAIVCAVGVALIGRCAWFRRRGAAPPPPPPQPNKGLNKNAINALPKLSYTKSTELFKTADCAICLTEFEEDDEVRVLPQCGHSFHVSCVDEWLAKHSSCPSCRAVLATAAPPRCRKCGAASTDDRFLP